MTQEDTWLHEFVEYVETYGAGGGLSDVIAISTVPHFHTACAY
jgi:hypothetical protein